MSTARETVVWWRHKYAWSSEYALRSLLLNKQVKQGNLKSGHNKNSKRRILIKRKVYRKFSKKKTKRSLLRLTVERGTETKEM
jgi:hypothetical protein